MAELARTTTVAQLRRVLQSYTPHEDEEPKGEEKREVSFGHTEEGRWRLCAELPVFEAQGSR